MKSIDLLLIRPGNQKSLYGPLSAHRHTGIEPPLWAAILAAFVRERGYRVEIIDADVSNDSHETTAKRIIELSPLLAHVVVSGTNPSASTWNMTGAGILLSRLKQTAPNIKTMISGLHPSALPDHTMKTEAVDFLCQGEGFYTIPPLLESLRHRTHQYSSIPGLWYQENDQIMSNPRPPLFKNLAQLPMPAWDLLPMKEYRAHNWHCMDSRYERQPYGIIYTSLGCPFSCDFCCINSFFGKNTIRYRPPANVVAEIDYLVQHYAIKNIRIIDEMFALRPLHVIQLCDLIIHRGYDLNMWIYARVDTVTPAMLSKMKQAGINWICYGFEAANQKVLDAVRKGYKQTDLYQAVRITREAGLYILANYMFGLPDDTMETMRETLDQAKALNCEYANLYCCMAHPGSKLYADAVDRGIKLPDTWEGYSQLSYETLPLPTKYVSASDVLRFRDMAFKEYFSNPAYLKMIREKFGPQAVTVIQQMLNTEIKRKYA